MTPSKPTTIEAYNRAQAGDDPALCDRLRALFDQHLPEAESKIWHAHPVWFLDGNPIVGYSRLKRGIRVLFWSGQSFATPGLVPEGSFKAAEIGYATPAEIDAERLGRWLAEARSIQWDYKNIVRKRRLDPLF